MYGIFLALLLSFVIQGSLEYTVIGGHDATEGEIPYLISLQIPPLIFAVCGGVIISPSWVLTAASCLTRDHDNRAYRVTAGITNLKDVAHQQVARIHYVKNHPLYDVNVRLSAHNIGLIKLKTPMNFTELVQTAKLPVENFNTTGIVTLAGWGNNNTVGISPSILQIVDVPVIPAQECLDVVSKNTPDVPDIQVSDDLTICTGPLSGGFGSCYGDNGGPIIQNGTVVGIVSWCNSPCGGPNKPSVYTKVSTFISWIKETVDEPLGFNL